MTAATEMWAKQCAEQTAEIDRLRAALQCIVGYPPSQDFERDERGGIKNGAMAWDHGGALHHVKQIAAHALQQSTPANLDIPLRGHCGSK